MKITIEQMVNATGALTWLSTEKLPTNYSFMVKRLLRAITPESQTYEQSRIETLEEHGEKTEDGQGYSVPPENVAQFREAMTALLAVEIEVPDTTIPSSIWEEIEPAYLMQLDWLIEEVAPGE